jgi:predicted ArsR family transcriptional regulator
MTDESGVDLWKEHQSAFDRVRSVAVTLSEPRSADWVAETAHVAGNTARNHLQRLVEMNVLQEVSGDSATRYRPDPLYTRMRALRDLLDGRDRDDLIELRADLQERIESWRAEYDVESAADLRERAARAETADETRDLRQTASDWDVVRYRLRLVEDAIEHYSDYTGTTPTPA